MPPIEADSKADDVREEYYPQYEALRMPITPASPGALTRLLNIIKQVPDDEISRQHKQRLQQKVSNAAQLFLAKNALLEDRNRFLTTVNDEGKARRSTRSEILGKARVMSCEDLEEARANRAAKEAVKEAKKADTAGKRKHDRKREHPEQKGIPGAEAEIAWIGEAQVEEDKTTPAPWRAPVARMW